MLKARREDGVLLTESSHLHSDRGVTTAIFPFSDRIINCNLHESSVGNFDCSTTSSSNGEAFTTDVHRERLRYQVHLHAKVATTTGTAAAQTSALGSPPTSKSAKRTSASRLAVSTAASSPETSTTPSASSIYGVLSSSVKVGIGLGIPLAFLVVAVLVFFFMRRRRQRSGSHHSRRRSNVDRQEIRSIERRHEMEHGEHVVHRELEGTERKELPIGVL